MNSCFDVDLAESQLDDLTEDIMKMEINKENNDEPPSMGSNADMVWTIIRCVIFRSRTWCFVGLLYVIANDEHIGFMDDCSDEGTN